MNNFFSYFISLIIIILLFSFICFISISYGNESYINNNTSNNQYFFSNIEYTWPTPGYHTITSYFGKRVSPTTGASTNHSGIDIAASEGASVFSIISGTVTLAEFFGANGYTIIIEKDNMSFQYSHLSSNYILGVRRHC